MGFVHRNLPKDVEAYFIAKVNASYQFYDIAEILSVIDEEFLRNVLNIHVIDEGKNDYLDLLDIFAVEYWLLPDNIKLMIIPHLLLTNHPHSDDYGYNSSYFLPNLFDPKLNIVLKQFSQDQLSCFSLYVLLPAFAGISIKDTSWLTGWWDLPYAVKNDMKLLNIEDLLVN